MRHAPPGYAPTDLVRLAAELAAIVESCDDAIVSKDLNGIITSWNDGAERLFGYTADEAIGQSVTMLIPSDRADEEPAILDRLSRGERVDHFESIRIAKDGKLLNVSLTISPVRDATGRIVGASKIARDITERNRAAESLREKKRQFRVMIDALPIAIYTTDAAGSLTHFNPAAVEFSGRVPELGSDHWCVTWKLYFPDGTPMPHDQCPMAMALKEGRAIRGVEAIAELPDGRRRWFEPFPTPLFDADGKLVGGINMLLDTTERRRTEAALRDADQPLIESSRHRLDIDLPAESMIVEADPVRLAQVLANLLNNAAKYTEEGGNIRLVARREGSAVSISVRDNGIGIAADMLDKVFDLFRQIDRSLSRAQGGLGIGLTLVKRLVEMHGGTIHAQSGGLGHGAEFVVRLPLAAQRRGVEELHPPLGRLAAISRRRILVVDDHQDSANSLSALLRMQPTRTPRPASRKCFARLTVLGCQRPWTVP